MALLLFVIRFILACLWDVQDGTTSKLHKAKDYKNTRCNPRMIEQDQDTGDFANNLVVAFRKREASYLVELYLET